MNDSQITDFIGVIKIEPDIKTENVNPSSSFGNVFNFTDNVNHNFLQRDS